MNTLIAIRYLCINILSTHDLLAYPLFLIISANYSLQSEFLCPVTALPMNGINGFVVNWKCGCVFSEKALQEVISRENLSFNAFSFLVVRFFFSMVLIFLFFG